MTANPPSAHKKPSILEHPRIAEWLAKLLEMRGAGRPVTNQYIANVLTRGALAEGILAPGESVKVSNVGRHLRERARVRP